MEVRPIDANALFDALRDNEFQTFCPLDEVDDVIAAAPTIDYAPVIHARWLMRDDGEGLRRVCSRCGKESKQETPFCAQCGAMMDGGK